MAVCRTASALKCAAQVQLTIIARGPLKKALPVMLVSALFATNTQLDLMKKALPVMLVSALFATNLLLLIVPDLVAQVVLDGHAAGKISRRRVHPI